jgi:hypothetical protein
MFTSWVKYHFRDVDHARMSISVIGGTLGLIGVGIVLLGALLA